MSLLRAYFRIIGPFKVYEPTGETKTEHHLRLDLCKVCVERKMKDGPSEGAVLACPTRKSTGFTNKKTIKLKKIQIKESQLGFS